MFPTRKDFAGVHAAGFLNNKMDVIFSHCEKLDLVPMAEQTFSHRENFSIPMASQIFLTVRILRVICQPPISHCENLQSQIISRRENL